MKPTQIIVLGLALAAGGGAYFVATSMTSSPVTKTKTKKVIVKAKTERVLVADKRIPLGQKLKEERLRWQEWPKSGLTEGMVTKKADPEAIKGHSKLIARATIYPGEPIRAEKLVRSDRGYMSAILPKGYRAVAIGVSAISTAGGFVLPNDRVDVMVTGRGAGEGTSTAEIVLQNVRVLAINRRIEEKKDGSKSIVGKTATLQVTPEDAAKLTEARIDAGISGSSMSLVLRSIADSGVNATDIIDTSAQTKRMISAGRISRLKLKTDRKPTFISGGRTARTGDDGIVQQDGGALPNQSVVLPSE